METIHDLVPKSLATVALRAPQDIIQEASERAKALKEMVEKTHGSIQIGGNEHLRIEAWTTIADFYGCKVQTVDAQAVEVFGTKGFKAMASVVHVASSRVVTTAEAYCLQDEPTWTDKALFQLASMAQTRAASKACSLAFRWVVVLSGFDATPAEEMAGIKVALPEPQTLDLGLMPFGKHKGKRLADVPTDYLGWLLGDLKEKQKRPELQEALINELEARAMVPEHVTTKGDVNLFEYAKNAILNEKNKGVAIATRAQYRTDGRLNFDQQVALDDVFNAKWAPPLDVPEPEPES